MPSRFLPTFRNRENVRRSKLKHSYSGRMAFLEAIENTWTPSPLEMLAPATKAVQSWFLDLGLLAEVPREEHGREATDLKWAEFSCSDDPGTKATWDALAEWQRFYKIDPADLWIMDAALQTCGFAAFRGKSRPGEWVYYPTEKTWPKFNPKFSDGRWHGDLIEPWATFARRVRGELNKELKAYHLILKRMSLDPEPRNEEARDAEWLARYLRGDSWEQIAADLSPKFREPKATAVNYTIRFAERISVTVPKRRPGRRKRGGGPGTKP